MIIAINIDDNGYLACDYPAWNLLAKSNNPGIKYWLINNNG